MDTTIPQNELSDLQKLAELEQQYAAAKEAHKQAEATYKQRVQHKQEELDAARRALTERLKPYAQKRDEAEADLNEKIFAVAGATLLRSGVKAKGMFFSFDETFEISFNQTGSIYTTTEVSGGGSSLSGALVGGLLFGAAGAIIGSRKAVKTETVTHDDRKWNITMSGNKQSCSISISASKVGEAQNFVSLARKTCSEFKVVGPALTAALKQAEEAIAKIEAADTSISVAQAALDAERANTKELDAAALDLRQAKELLSAARAKSPKRQKLKSALYYLAACILLGLGLYAIYYGFVSDPHNLLISVITGLIFATPLCAGAYLCFEKGCTKPQE